MSKKFNVRFKGSKGTVPVNMTVSRKSQRLPT